MTPTNAGFQSLNRWKQSGLIGGLASLVYAGIVTIYSVLSPNVSLSGSLGASFGIAALFALGTIGLSYSGYDIRSPAVLMAFILLFWHVLIHLPILGSEGGDTPAFALVLFWAPFYLVAYALVGGGEYWLRQRGSSRSMPSV